MPAFKDLTGQRFDRLTVIERCIDANLHGTVWKCKCDCGNVVDVFAGNLTRGHTKSCGCLRIETTIESHTTHNLVNHPLYIVWGSMKKRCTNPNCDAYHNYGGRGITICNEWLDNFKAFYDWAISNGYTSGLTLDRIDNDGNYEPSNCRWVDKATQVSNRRNTRFITYNGKTQSLKAWADELNLDYHALYSRIARGWDLKDALAKEMVG